jgi:hypothetical protein
VGYGLLVPPGLRSRGLSFSGAAIVTSVPQQGRTIFLVDGFNLYASLCLASEGLAAAGQPAGTKWLDLRSLCGSFLALVRSPLEPQAILARIDYFTALAPWSQETRRRHQRYIECLRASSVNVRMGRFKHKEASPCAPSAAVKPSKAVDSQTSQTAQFPCLLDDGRPCDDRLRRSRRDGTMPCVRHMRSASPRHTPLVAERP